MLILLLLIKGTLLRCRYQKLHHGGSQIEKLHSAQACTVIIWEKAEMTKRQKQGLSQKAFLPCWERMLVHLKPPKAVGTVTFHRFFTMLPSTIGAGEQLIVQPRQHIIQFRGSEIKVKVKCHLLPVCKCGYTAFEPRGLKGLLVSFSKFS